MEYKYSLTNDVRKALERCEYLGKDNVEQAALLVLSPGNDWRSYPPLQDADIDDLSAIAKWQADTLEANGVEPFTINSIYENFKQ